MDLAQAFASQVPVAVVYPVSHAAGMSVIRALQGKVPIVAVDHKPDSAGLRSRHVIPYLIPAYAHDHIHSYLLVRGRQFAEKPVLFLVDDEDVYTSLQQEKFGEVYRLPSSGWETVEPIVNKGLLYAKLRGAGFPIPRTWFPPDFEAVMFPCIVKPTYSTTFRERFGVKAIRCDAPGDLAHAMASVNMAGIPYVIQEYIPGNADQLYTFAAYSDDHGNVLASFTGRKLHQYPRDFGTARLAESVDCPEVARLGRRFLKLVQYKGISLTEFKRHPDGSFRLIEMNPRPGGWPERLAQACGVNLVLTAYEDAIRTVPPPPRPKVPLPPDWIEKGAAPSFRWQKPKHKKWANSMEDAYLFRSLRWIGATDAFFDWRDPMPFLVRLRGWAKQVMSK